MNETILILGTGKMARNIGLFLIQKGYTISWTSQNQERLDVCRKFIDKKIKRILNFSPTPKHPLKINFFLSNQIPNIPFNIIIESTTESLGAKKTLLHCIKHCFSKDTLFFTNSSSILPDTIYPNCLGCHFFYPIEMTKIVEMIIPDNFPIHKKEKSLSLLKYWDLSIIEQSYNNAFAINRLLLPMQAETFRLLSQGYSPKTIEEYSKTPLLPIGQLSFMDSVGLDVINNSIEFYINRMPDKNKEDYSVLNNTLCKLIESGKLGNKNKNGLLQGEKLSYKIINIPNSHISNLKHHFLFLFYNTCLSFLQSNQIKKHKLQNILSTLFFSDVSVSDIEKKYSNNKIQTYCRDYFNQTGLSYFYPFQ